MNRFEELAFTEVQLGERISCAPIYGLPDSRVKRVTLVNVTDYFCLLFHLPNIEVFDSFESGTQIGLREKKLIESKEYNHNKIKEIKIKYEKLNFYESREIVLSVHPWKQVLERVELDNLLINPMVLANNLSTVWLPT